MTEGVSRQAGRGGGRGEREGGRGGGEREVGMSKRMNSIHIALYIHTHTHTHTCNAILGMCVPNTSRKCTYNKRGENPLAILK